MEAINFDFKIEDNVFYKEGIEKGLQRGIEKGIEKGRQQILKENVIALYENEVPRALIAKALKLSLDEVKALLK